MNIKKDFGLRVKEIRQNKGITQYQLAEAVGIDPKHISHIETGGSFPKADLIEKLANALNVEYIEFFNTKHMQSRQQLLEKIYLLLNNADNNELKKIYKIISGFML